MLRGIRGGEERVNFRSDGTPELVGKPFNVEKRGDGSFTVQITTKSKEDLQRLIPHIAAQIGCPVKELMTILEQGEVSFTARRPGAVHHRFIFGGPEALRSVMKSCLVLWSTVVGNEELKSDPYGEARRFVVAGDESFNQRRIHLDSRHLSCGEELKARFGHLFNLIYVRSDSAGRVVGHFTLHNAIGWQLVLAESGGSPNISVGLISNPLNPAEWSDTIANEVDIDFDWLSCLALPDFTKARERFNAIVEQHFSRRRPRELENIVDDVCERHGISGDDPIPDALQEQIFSEISERAALLIHNLPYKRALSRAEIKDLLKGI